MSGAFYPPIGVPIYSTIAQFPPGGVIGELGVAQDSGALYEWDGSAWQQIGGPGSTVTTVNGISGAVNLVAGSNITITPTGQNITIAATGGGGGSGVNTIGTIDSVPATADGAAITGTSLILQSASDTDPGLVNTTTQTFAGDKTIDGNLAANNFSGSSSGTNTGDVSVTSFGSTPNANGLSLTGQALNLQPADATHSGGLSSTDWNTFNGKQPAGNYITALTGDGTASGPGSSALALATVNANVGSFGSASGTGAFTVNAKGLVTAAATTSIQITESQVTNLVSNLAAKQATGNYITALTGDVTASGPGSAAATLSATSNSTLTTLSALSLPLSQTTGVLPIANGGTNNGSLAVTAGGVIYSDGSKLVNVGAGSSGQLLKSNGSSPPSWITTASSPTALTVQRLLSTGTQTGWLFTISTSSTVAIGDTYTNNSNTYTVQIALSAQSGQVLFMSGTGATSGTTLTRATGSGTSSITFSATLATATYTTPTSPAPLYLKPRISGGGGGGSGSGTSGGTAAGTGGTTVFGPSLSATGGAGAAFNSTPGAGGTASVSSPAVAIVSLTGGQGSGTTFPNNGTAVNGGGTGGNNPFGGAGGAGGAGFGSGSAVANSGGGGGGASAPGGNLPGPGGGAGGYAEAIISSPSATYPYSVGVAGTAGGAGGGTGSAGGAGGSGVIIIEEHYQ